jgi:hypothetical protein
MSTNGGGNQKLVRNMSSIQTSPIKANTSALDESKSAIDNGEVLAQDI